MKIKKLIVLFFLLLATSSHADELLSGSAFTYLGAFTVPDIGSDAYHGTPYGGSCIAYNPAGNSGAGSLYITAFSQNARYISEVSIPSNLYAGTSVESLPVASILYGSPYFWDITEGNYAEIGEDGAVVNDSYSGFGMGGMLVYDDKILATSYTYYGSGSYLPMYFHDSLTPSATGVFDGMHGLNISDLGVGYGDFHSGALTMVPTAYQAQLGGTVIAGANPFMMSIVSRTSYGPSIVAFDPANFGNANTVSSTVNGYALATYPQNHQTLGSWDDLDANEYFSIADSYGSLIFPDGSRSVLVIGRHGSGNPGLTCTEITSDPASCYGLSTSNCLLHGTSAGDHPYCYDPDTDVLCDSWNNTAWPYSNYVWAFDVGDSSGNNTPGNTVLSGSSTHSELNNLTAVKLGLIEPWDMRPHAVWPLPDPESLLSKNFSGRGATCYVSGTYDSSTGRAYFSVFDVTSGRLPVIEVYQITVPDGGTYDAPIVEILTESQSTTAETITIIGTLTTDSELTGTGVGVNGIAATADDGTWDEAVEAWTALGVTLSLGANTITATGTDSEAETDTDTVIITRTAPGASAGVTLQGVQWNQ